MTTDRADQSDDGVEAVTVRLDLAAAPRLREIVERLRKLGLRDIETHARLMMVSGRVAASRKARLMEIAGVVAVTEERKYEKR